MGKHIRRGFLVGVLVFALVGGASATPTLPGPLPTGSPESQGVDSGRLTKMVDYWASSGAALHSLLVIRHGVKILDVSAFPYSSRYPHVIYSCTKSVTSALIGTLIDAGTLAGVDVPVLGLFPGRSFQNPSEGKQQLTVRHLLTMTSGVEWTEDGTYDDQDSWMQMARSADPLAFYLDRPLTAAPGSRFQYNTGSTHVLGAVAEKASGKPLDVLARNLFDPLGIETLWWNRDRTGAPLGGSGLVMKPEDLAKFGLLFLHRGESEGMRLLSERWVDESTALQVNTPSGLAGRSGYGYQWWRNPFGGYSARGYRGQYLFVIPEQDLIVVTTASLPGSEFYLPETLVQAFIIPALHPTPLPEDPSFLGDLDRAVAALAQAPQALPSDPAPRPARYRLEDGNTVFELTDTGARLIDDQGTWPIGLGVWNITVSDPTLGRAVALRGRWVGPRFEWSSRDLNGEGEDEVVATFDGDAVEIEGVGGYRWSVRGWKEGTSAASAP